MNSGLSCALEPPSVESRLRLPAGVTPVGTALHHPGWCKHPGVWHQIPRGTHPGDRLHFSPGAAELPYLTCGSQSGSLSSKTFLPQACLRRPQGTDLAHSSTSVSPTPSIHREFSKGFLQGLAYWRKMEARESFWRRKLDLGRGGRRAGVVEG